MHYNTTPRQKKAKAIAIAKAEHVNRRLMSILVSVSVVAGLLLLLERWAM